MADKFLCENSEGPCAHGRGREDVKTTPITSV